MKKGSDLRQAMEALLNIYNLNTHKKKSKTWPWKEIQKNLKIFTNSIFDKSKQRCDHLIGEKTLLITIDAKANFINLPPIKMGYDEIQNLCKLLNTLKQEIDLDITHFVIKELNMHTYITRDETYEYEYFKSDTQLFVELLDLHLFPLINSAVKKKEEKERYKIKAKNKKLYEQLFACFKTDAKDFKNNISIIKQIIKYNSIPKKKSAPIMYEVLKLKKFLMRRKKDVSILEKMQKLSYQTIKTSEILQKPYGYSNLNSQVYSEITVTPKSFFAQQLFYSGLEKHNSDMKINVCTVPSLEFNSWKSFQEILKSFFVEYCLVSDQFKNLKLCQNKKCKKLILEVRKNQRQFCGSKCRQTYFKKDPKNKCRDNQNQWIRAQFYSDSPIIIKFIQDKTESYSGDKIKIDDCQDCAETLSRGHCRNIVIKNPILIDFNPKCKKKILKQI